MKLKLTNPMRYLMIGAAVILTLGLTQCQSPADQISTAPAVTSSSKKAATVESAPSDWRTAIAKVARENIPAVVHITVTERREVSAPASPFSNDPFFHFFFNGPQQQQPRKFKREMMALGSGMIIDTEGHILTNNHVVAGATSISVLLNDGNSYPAKIVGTDPKTDLAVIKISASEKLPTVTFGNSDKIQVGDWVVAIGQPRGLDQSVTQGIISAKHRTGIMNPTSYQDYLQTDAAINPGNSGGPLLNLAGQVIGVNAAIATESGGFEGIGFAIPSNMAVHVAKELIKNGKVIRGWLGVSISDVSPNKAKSLGLKDHNGALIADVMSNSPADKAGIKKDDVVVSFRGESVENAADLQRLVGDTPVGDTVHLKVMRNGKPLELTVTMGNQENAEKKIAASLEDRLGAVVRPLTNAERSKYNLEGDQGVAIEKIDNGGPLANAGFEKDDVILGINNIPVTGVENFVAMIKSLPPHQQILLQGLDHRTGRTGYVKVEIN